MNNNEFKWRYLYYKCKKLEYFQILRKLFANKEKTYNIR